MGCVHSRHCCNCSGGIFACCCGPCLETCSAKPRVSQHKGTYYVPGLQTTVKITRDESGGDLLNVLFVCLYDLVPHIDAESILDMFFAQGFVHAQDRLWQMELQRRVSQGRLSELLGRGPNGAVFEIDRCARTFGWGRLASQDWQTLQSIFVIVGTLM